MISSLVLLVAKDPRGIQEFDLVMGGNSHLSQFVNSCARVSWCDNWLTLLTYKSHTWRHLPSDVIRDMIGLFSPSVRQCTFGVLHSPPAYGRSSLGVTGAWTSWNFRFLVRGTLMSLQEMVVARNVTIANKGDQSL